MFGVVMEISSITLPWSISWTSPWYPLELKFLWFHQFFPIGQTSFWGEVKEKLSLYLLETYKQQSYYSGLSEATLSFRTWQANLSFLL